MAHERRYLIAPIETPTLDAGSMGKFSNLIEVHLSDPDGQPSSKGTLAVVDSGAFCCAIGSKLLSALELSSTKKHPLPEGTDLFGADAESIEDAGYILLDLTIKDHAGAVTTFHRVPFAVIEGGMETILGQSVLQHLDLSWSKGRMYLTTNSSQLSQLHTVQKK